MSKSEPFDENSTWSTLPNSIGLLGGTGPEGRGIAARFASVGLSIVIGSREKNRAKDAAQSILSVLPLADVTGTDNEDMIRRCDVIFITVPFVAQQQALRGLAPLFLDKIVVCTTVPVEFSNNAIELAPVLEGGAALQAQADLPEARIVGAFQNIAAADLWNIADPLDADVIIASDSETAKQRTMELCSLLPNLGVVDGGGLNTTPYLEALTVLLLRINKNYPGKHATFKLSGIFS